MGKGKVYNQKDFDKPRDAIQKLQIANVQSEFALQLNDWESRYLELLRCVYPILCAPVNIPEKMKRVRSLMLKHFTTSEHLKLGRIVNVMNDAQILFLNSATIPPNLLRGAMNEDLFGNVEFLKTIRDDTDAEKKDRINAALAITKTWVEIAKHNPISEPEKEAAPTEFAYSVDMDLENEIMNENTVHEPTDSPNQGV